MKTKLLLASLLSLAAFSAACQRDVETRTTGVSNSPNNPNTAPAAARQMEQTQAAGQELARDMNDYAFAQRATYTSQMQAQVDELKRNIDDMSERIDNSSAAVKAEARPRLETLRTQADALQKQVDATKDATTGTWNTVKADSQRAFTSLQQSLADARQWVSEKTRS